MMPHMQRGKPKDPIFAFEQNMPLVIEAVLALEGGEGLNEVCSCEVGRRTTKCGDCCLADLSCEQCFLESHRRNPLHWAFRWNGFYYSKVSQKKLGRIVHLGHKEHPCPQIVIDSTPTNLQIVHTNGVHDIEAYFCRCQNAQPRWKQLIDAGYFPGTLNRPETAFTVSLMKFAHALSTIGHASAMDIATAIRRITNGAFVDEVPVRAICISFKIKHDYNQLHTGFLKELSSCPSGMENSPS